MASLLTMASSSKNATDDDGVKPTIFHDFLGKNCGSDSLPAAAKAAAAGDVEASPSASASAGASSGGGRGPISATSDLGSERQVSNHFEGVPFYGPRSELGNRFKRSNSDSAFMGSSRDGFPQMRPDSLESSHLMKMLRSVGGERPRRPLDEETFVGMHPLRPTSASLIVQSATSDRTASKWERAIPMSIGTVMQHPPRAGQVIPFGYQAMSNRFKDTNAGPPIISQAAADEGSRTGIKRSGLLSSLNASSGNADRNLPSGGKQKSGVCEPESSNPMSRQGSTYATRQMTIFYAGQAHVFDDVHPNKEESYTLGGLKKWAWRSCEDILRKSLDSEMSSVPEAGLMGHGGEDGDDCNGMMTSLVVPSTLKTKPTISQADVIMALAGSNGGSWSTNYAPKSAVRPNPGENYLPSGEKDAGMASQSALSRELHGRLAVMGNSSHGFESVDRISILPGRATQFSEKCAIVRFWVDSILVVRYHD
ncbi:hypothetical protein RJ639_015594 [Escallonia herrerae]|uniref:Protein TIFY n=1 Tax=Escallonia herrerae TaxID=1293975 RepID=A0AA88VD61_9ASTE|nr:hypothetical protein RJ639_015594 [Escallonia herrerae]